MQYSLAVCQVSAKMITKACISVTLLHGCNKTWDVILISREQTFAYFLGFSCLNAADSGFRSPLFTDFSGFAGLVILTLAYSVSVSRSGIIGVTQQ